MNKTQERVSEKVRDHCTKQIEKLIELKEVIKNIPLPDLPDEIYNLNSMAHFIAYVGFSPDNVRLVFAGMEEVKWSTTSKPENVIAKLKSGEYMSDFVGWYHNDFSRGFYTDFIVGGTGSNCQRVKVGTETVEKDIFEVICNEGIEEEE